jgi:hypothetical protein
MREDIAGAIKGCGALREALDMIGSEDKTDHHVAKVITDHETEIEALIRFALTELASA